MDATKNADQNNLFGRFALASLPISEAITEVASIDLIYQEQVLQLNTCALARFQSFPDCYVLPDLVSVAGRIIGNAVPPAMARSVALNTVFHARQVYSSEAKG